MKLKLLSKLIIFCIIFSIFIPISTAEKQNRSVWAVHADGSKTDIFDLGERVYIEGQKLGKSQTFTWQITNQDDPAKPVVASGSGIISSGTICHLDTGYNIPSDVYPIHFKLRVTIKKGDHCEYQFKTKKDSFESIPEFPTIVLPVAMILGLMFIFVSRKEE